MHHWNRGIRAALVASTAAVALIAFSAATAFAAPGVKVGTATVNVSATVFPYLGTATARCPGGSKIVSGGFYGPSDPSQLTADIVSITSSRASKKSWSTTAVNNGGTDGPLTSYAYCLKGLKLKSASGTGSVAPAGTGFATAQCPRGTKVISGGFQTPSYDPAAIGPRSYVYSSQKSGNRSWTVAGANDGVAAGTLIAVAYCVNGKGPKTRSTSVPIADGTGNNTFATATAACRRHELLVSGGFNTPGFDYNDTFGPDVFYTRSFKGSGQTWTVGGDNIGKAGSITAIAYCYKV